MGSIPRQGTKILHAAVCQKKKKKKVLEQDSGDLDNFFTRDKQALVLRDGGEDDRTGFINTKLGQGVGTG